MTLASPLSNSLPASILASTLISLLPSQPAFTQTLWLPFPFDSKGVAFRQLFQFARGGWAAKVVKGCIFLQGNNSMLVNPVGGTLNNV